MKSAALRSLAAALPNYTVVREIHHGNQGVVVEAVQKSTKRSVAIKLLLDGAYASPAARGRFEREIEMVARLTHPNIVAVFDSGLTRDGRQYCVMDYVPGLPLDRHIREQRPSLAQVLELFVEICQAVSHAHQKGVIHRDLKPSNILVSAAGAPKVLDFGLAKFAVDQPDASRVTQTGEFVGTPAYAAPEQVQLDCDAVDVRTDVYALGMILFEMLTGRLAYPISRNIAELVETIINARPQRPSTLNTTVDRELDTIVLKALEKDPAQRYQSVDALAADLRRYQAGEAILAHPPSTAYQLRKLVRRHRLPFAFGATLLVLLIGFSVVTAIQSARLRVQRDQAVRATERESRQRALAQRKTREAEDSAAEARRRLREAEWQTYVASIAAADAALRAGDTRTARRRFDRVPKRLMNWEWEYLARRIDRGADPVAAELGQHAGNVRALAFSPDATRLACGAADGQLALWSISSNARITDLRGHEGPVRGVAFSPDGSVIASGAADGTVRLWDAANGAPRVTLASDAGVECVAFSPGGSIIAAGLENGTIALWDVAQRRRRATLQGHTARVAAVAFGPDGQLLASGSADSTVLVWKLADHRRIETLSVRGRGVRALAFSPVDPLLACGSSDGGITLWEPSSGKLVTDRVGHEQPVNSLAFSPDGTRLVSGSDDATVKLWDMTMRGEVLTLYNPAGPVRAVAFSPDGARIAAATGASIRVWQGRMSAEELVELMLSGTASAAEMIVSLQADDAMDPALRDAALRIMCSRVGGAASQASAP